MRAMWNCGCEQRLHTIWKQSKVSQEKHRAHNSSEYSVRSVIFPVNFNLFRFPSNFSDMSILTSICFRLDETSSRSLSTFFNNWLGIRSIQVALCFCSSICQKWKSNKSWLNFFFVNSIPFLVNIGLLRKYFCLSLILRIFFHMNVLLKFR